MEEFEPFVSYLSASELTLVAMLLFILLLIRQNHRANIFLALFIFSIAMPIPVSLAFKASKPAGHTLFFFSMAITSISGSLIFLYIKSITGEFEKIRVQDLRHLLPCPVMLAGLFIYRFTIFEPEMHAGKSVFVASMAVVSLVIPTIYTIVSFIKLRKYKARIENWFSDTERMSISWLYKITLMGLLLFCAWDLGFAAAAFHLIPRHTSFPIPHLALIAAICLMTTWHVVRQPDIFTASRDMNELKNDEIETAAGEEKEKYAKQSIDLAMQKQYLDTLLAHMEEKKPYLDDGITIRSLSLELMIPIHHLSIVINNMLHRNFSTFVNEYRVKEALAMIEEAGEDANILSIAFSSGFNSKSSFNNAFKKITGKTPSEYRPGKSA
jgi:AraC-like DNA-binding protein